MKGVCLKILQGFWHTLSVWKVPLLSIVKGMTSELIIDVQPKEISIALLEDKSLVEYQSESRSASFMKASQKKAPYPPIGQARSLPCKALKSHAYRQASVREPQTSLNLSVVRQRIVHQTKTCLLWSTELFSTPSSTRVWTQRWTNQCLCHAMPAVSISAKTDGSTRNQDGATASVRSPPSWSTRHAPQPKPQVVTHRNRLTYLQTIK